MSKPNPGSHEALQIGCQCPILDNGYGSDELGKIRGFWINNQCPVHGPRGCDKCGDSEFIDSCTQKSSISSDKKEDLGE